MKKEQEEKYNKMQLIKSEKYLYQKDLISAVLEDNKQYTLTEVDTAIENFRKRMVK